MNKKQIKVAIVGVGNCAKSLVEGVAHHTITGSEAGLAWDLIGGYEAADLQFVTAYDVDTRKVGRHLSEAIFAAPNCAMDILSAAERDALPTMTDTIARPARVRRAPLLDGVAPHMLTEPEHRSFRVTKDREPTHDECVQQLKDDNVDILINYLPVGSETATRFWVEVCLEARVPFVNCIPVFIVSDPYWERRLKEARIPAIGDDMRSQLGASVMSQAIQELFFDRGMSVQFHSQTNHGGNTDFLNMEDASRLESKRISKENVIRSQNDLREIDVPTDGIYAGPSSYIPFHGDNKVAHFRVEGTGFGGAPVVFDARLSVQDSPNSAGVVIDAVRYLKTAHEMGLVGSLRGPSAATQKTPPSQMMLSEAMAECEALAARQLTHSLETHNLLWTSDHPNDVISDATSRTDNDDVSSSKR
jgi:myo-inositol-1-phosphate synthase